MYASPTTINKLQVGLNYSVNPKQDPQPQAFLSISLAFFVWFRWPQVILPKEKNSPIEHVRVE